MWPNFGRGDIVARMELHGLHTEDTPAGLSPAPHANTSPEWPQILM